MRQSNAHGAQFRPGKYCSVESLQCRILLIRTTILHISSKMNRWGPWYVIATPGNYVTFPCPEGGKIRAGQMSRCKTSSVKSCLRAPSASATLWLLRPPLLRTKSDDMRILPQKLSYIRNGISTVCTEGRLDRLGRLLKKLKSARLLPISKK